MQQWLVNNWIGVLSTALGGVLVWFITYWIGKPIVDVRDKRIKALHAAEQNAHVGYAATDERIVAARTALNEAASALRAVSRGHGWPVRVYCWLARYDLEAAAYALISLHNKTGHPHYDDKTRQLVLVPSRGWLKLRSA